MFSNITKDQDDDDDDDDDVDDDDDDVDVDVVVDDDDDDVLSQGGFPLTSFGRLVDPARFRW